MLTEYVRRSLLCRQSNETVGVGLGAGLKLVTGGAAVRLGQNVEDTRRNSLTDIIETFGSEEVDVIKDNNSRLVCTPVKMWTSRTWAMKVLSDVDCAQAAQTGLLQC